MRTDLYEYMNQLSIILVRAHDDGYHQRVLADGAANLTDVILHNRERNRVLAYFDATQGANDPLDALSEAIFGAPNS